MNPKRPDHVFLYKSASVDAESSSDFFQLLAFFIGFLSMMIRVWLIEYINNNNFSTNGGYGWAYFYYYHHSLTWKPKENINR